MRCMTRQVATVWLRYRAASRGQKGVRRLKLWETILFDGTKFDAIILPRAAGKVALGGDVETFSIRRSLLGRGRGMVGRIAREVEASRDGASMCTPVQVQSKICDMGFDLNDLPRRQDITNGVELGGDGNVPCVAQFFYRRDFLSQLSGRQPAGVDTLSDVQCIYGAD